jgi:hypothetical protein
VAEQKSQEMEQEARASEAQMAEVLKLFIEGQITRTTAPREHKEVWTGQTNKVPCLVPPGDPRLNGRSYEHWAAAWWKWALEMPKTNSAGVVHPLFDSPRFDVSTYQSSEVWFLAGPFGQTRRSCTIPPGKALFFPLFAVECSNIEAAPFYGATAEAQASMAQFWADKIVDVFCELDGVRLSNLEAYGVQNPQVHIDVPAPWILGTSGGKGTSSGYGYFVFLAPLPPGEHTLRFGGAMELTKGEDPTPADQRWEIDVTYQLTVAEEPLAHTRNLSNKKGRSL